MNLKILPFIVLIYTPLIYAESRMCNYEGACVPGIEYTEDHTNTCETYYSTHCSQTTGCHYVEYKYRVYQGTSAKGLKAIFNNRGKIIYNFPNAMLFPDGNGAYGGMCVIEPKMIIPPIPPLTPNRPRAEKCPVGYTGKIQYKWEVYYTDDVYQTTYTDGTPATVTQKTPHQREVLDFNSCKLIPTQTTQERPDVQEESCDSYFGVAPGTYTGMVQKYGTYKSVYDSNSKTTTTTFVVESVDSTSCVSQFTNTGLETSTMPCPAGQTGSIELYRYKAENTLGQVIYPYGEQMIVGSNSCAGVQADTVIEQDAIPPSGLLGNISITSSDLKDSERFSKYLGELSGSGWSSNQTHKLIIEIDDLHTGTFSASKIGSAISKFQTTVGAENSEIEIKLPRSIDQFVGVGGITREAVQNKSISMKSVSFDGYDARVTYWELGNGSISKPQEKEAKINIIPKGMSLKRISGE